MKKLIAIFSLMVFNLSFSSAPVVNIYNWTDYLTPEIITQFTAETGIHVNYATFSEGDEAYMKIKANQGHSGFDVVVPSSDYIQRMSRENLLEKIDRKKLSNLHYINPALLHKSFDPNNDYSIPFLWGYTGLLFDKTVYQPKSIHRWKQLWEPRFRDQLLMLNDMRDVFFVALKVLGYPANDTNPKHLQQAYQKLLQLWPNIKLFNADTPSTIYANGDALVGQCWNGDAIKAMKRNPNMMFVLPTEGINVWMDSMVIPKHAPHLNNAYTFINFILRPDIAKKISDVTQYSSPNLGAIKLMPLSLQQNTILYPPPSVLARGSFRASVGSALSTYIHYWTRLKLSG